VALYIYKVPLFISMGGKGYPNYLLYTWNYRQNSTEQNEYSLTFIGIACTYFIFMTKWTVIENYDSTSNKRKPSASPSLFLFSPLYRPASRPYFIYGFSENLKIWPFENFENTVYRGKNFLKSEAPGVLG